MVVIDCSKKVEKVAQKLARTLMDLVDAPEPKARVYLSSGLTGLTPEH